MPNNIDGTKNNVFVTGLDGKLVLIIDGLIYLNELSWQKKRKYRKNCFLLALDGK